MVEEPEPEPKKPTRAGAARPEAPYPLTSLDEATSDEELRALLEKLKGAGVGKGLQKKLKSKGKAGVEALLKAMRAPAANVRAQAAQVLQRMDHRSKRYSQALNEMLLSDPDPDVRGMAGRALVYYQRHKLKHNTEALCEALEKDTTEAVRMHAAWALGASHDKRGAASLIGALDDESTDVRLRTVGALKRIKAKNAVPHLVGRLDDTNAMVKERALEALQALTGKNLGRESARWRKAYPLPE